MRCSFSSSLRACITAVELVPVAVRKSDSVVAPFLSERMRFFLSGEQTDSRSISALSTCDASSVSFGSSLTALLPTSNGSFSLAPPRIPLLLYDVCLVMLDIKLAIWVPFVQISLKIG